MTPTPSLPSFLPGQVPGLRVPHRVRCDGDAVCGTRGQGSRCRQLPHIQDGGAQIPRWRPLGRCADQGRQLSLHQTAPTPGVQGHVPGRHRGPPVSQRSAGGQAEGCHSDQV